MTNCINGLVNKYCAFVATTAAPKSSAESIFSADEPSAPILLQAERVKKIASIVVGVAVIASIIFGAVVGGAAWIPLAATLALTIGFSLLHRKAVASLQSRTEIPSTHAASAAPTATPGMPQLTTWQKATNAPLLAQLAIAGQRLQNAIKAVLPKDGSLPSEQQIAEYKAARKQVLKLHQDNANNPLAEHFSAQINQVLSLIKNTDLALKQ